MASLSCFISYSWHLSFPLIGSTLLAVTIGPYFVCGQASAQVQARDQRPLTVLTFRARTQPRGREVILTQCEPLIHVDFGRDGYC